MTISRALIQEFVKLAAPISLSKVISPIANVVLNQIMLAMGTNLVAVAGLGNRLSLLFYLPATAVGSAAVTLIAGNNDYKERKQLIKQLCVTSVLPTIVIIIVAFFVRGQLSQMLTADAAMQQAGKVYWTISLWGISVCSNRNDNDFCFTGTWLWIPDTGNYNSQTVRCADTIDIFGEVCQSGGKRSMGSLCSQ